MKRKEKINLHEAYIWQFIGWKAGSKLTLELALRGGLDGPLDLVVGDGLFSFAGKVDNGDVGGGHTHGHAGELAVEGRDDLPDSLGCAGAAGDDILRRRAATTPVLGGRAIDGLLGGRVGVDGRHEALGEAEVVMDDLCERGEAVGGAGGVGEDVDVWRVSFLVDAHDEHGGVCGGGGDDDLLGAAFQVGIGLFGGGEDAGGLDDVFGAVLGPGDVGWVSLLVEMDGLAVDGQAMVADGDVALELAVCGVIFEHVGL